jgi:hypothetical protein
MTVSEAVKKNSTTVADIIREKSPCLEGCHCQDKPDQHASLRQRVNDICSGAIGGAVCNDEPLGLVAASRFIPALQGIFRDLPDYVWFPHNLHRFSDIDSITEFIGRALAE